MKIAGWVIGLVIFGGCGGCALQSVDVRQERVFEYEFKETESLNDILAHANKLMTARCQTDGFVHAVLVGEPKTQCKDIGSHSYCRDYQLFQAYHCVY